MEETPRERITVSHHSHHELSTDQVGNRPGISDQSMGAVNRVGIELSYLPARLYSIGWWNLFLGIDFWGP